MSKENSPSKKNVTKGQPEIPNFLQLPTQALLDEFGAGRHKPGSGSAAALLGLVSCKLMQTVITVTRRNPRYSMNTTQLTFIESAIRERDEPFFRDAVQRDSEQFDRYHRAMIAKNAAKDEAQRARLTTTARQELMPATEIPLSIARQSVAAAERGLTVFDLGARYARGDSGVAISSALSACSGALFIVYLNLLNFREGRWAARVRDEADQYTRRLRELQFEQFGRVARMQLEGLDNRQTELMLDLQMPDDNEPT